MFVEKSLPLRAFVTAMIWAHALPASTKHETFLLAARRTALAAFPLAFTLGGIVARGRAPWFAVRALDGLSHASLYPIELVVVDAENELHELLQSEHRMREEGRPRVELPDGLPQVGQSRTESTDRSVQGRRPMAPREVLQ